ncbi:G patch domain-containing protein 8-like [Acipenser oxyrinchus oxyrinchus]|uniref:G patch domain-containing protein 8-like n=1 Tax=Acipenser oxyrinchus oxyrinchus TaxID=40147 RepID=A0AAD8LST6_ACIOX|nr:G patch domain-containing protein 8-like [Acipenser oxyrinchus oxyrinchus]
MAHQLKFIVSIYIFFSSLQDYAEKEKAIAKALEDLKANFYCELCDKQYHKHQEFDNHINSYDHAHKQRLKELKQREFARNVASKSWKDEKKQEKALKRLHQLAELQKQSECGPGSGPMFRATTVAAEDQQQERTFTDKDDGNGDRYILIGDGKYMAGTTSNNPLELPVTREQLHKSFGKIGIQLATDYNNQRAGVSFCFSKKAQMKLESSASVFSDTTEEANDREELHSQKGKQIAETFRAHIPSPGDPADDKEPKEQQMDNTTQNKQEKDPEFYQSVTTRSITDKGDFPLIVFTGSFENTDLDKGLPGLSHSPEADLDNNESNASNCFAARDNSSKDTHAEGDSSYQQRKVLIEEFIDTEPGTMTFDSDKVKPEESLGSISVVDDECAFKQACGESSRVTKTIGPFLDVLNKDGSTVLKWPSELLLHTKTEPCISYSCNPLYFDFKHSRKKHITQDGTLSVETEYCNVDIVDEESKKTIAELQTHNQETNLSDFFKPKKVKHYKAHQTLKLKLEAVNKASSSCEHNIKSKDGRGYRQHDVTHNESVNAKRFGFKKRKRSLNDESSNESDVTEQSKKNNNNPLSPSEDIGQNFNEEAPESDCRLKSKNTFLDFISNIGDSKKEIYRKTLSYKSSSYSSYSEMDTDSESWRYSSSFDSSHRSSSERGSSYSRTYGVTSSCSRTYSSCRSSDDSTSSNSHHCSARKSHQDYKNTHRHKMKNYSSSSEETNDDDEYFRYSRSRERKRSREHRTTQSRSRTSHSSSTSGQSSDWKRCSKPRSRSSRRSYRSDKSGSKSRHSSSNSDKKLSQRRSRSFSKNRLYCSKLPLAKNRETVKDTGRQHQTETGDPAQNCSRKYAVNCHKKMFPADKTNGGKNLLEKFHPKEPYEEKTHPSKALNISSVKLKDPPQVYFGSRIPSLLTNAPALPLIGKLPSAKKSCKKDEHNRNKSRDKVEVLKNNATGALIGPKQSETRLPEGEVTECNLQSSEVVLIEGQMLHTEGKELSLQNYCPVLQGLPEACSFSVNSTEEEKAKLPNTRKHFASREGSPQYLLKTKMQNVEETELQFENSKCVSPPLTEQPITFTPDEIDKYRLLQLQAQQHMQQQLLGKHAKVLPSPTEVPTFSPAPAFQPIPIQQPNPITSIHQALIQHHALAAFTSALHPHGSLQPLAHIHPFPQPHFNRISPFAPAIFPAHPAALLAGHPLHFFPTSSFHPAHLALHPMPHSSLLPTLLAPSPVMAAAAAASALHLHPYLHTLFPGQDLQPHSGHST